MQVQTKAIVFSSIKYGDSSLIVRCYTKEFGIKSYLLRSILKSKKGSLKPAYFQPLSQLDLVASHSKKASLHTIKEVRVAYAYEDVYLNYVKQSIVFFIAEMLYNSVREEEANEDLYAYLEISLKWLDLHDKVSNFHLIFLINLTRYLGFYPGEAKSDSSAFDLREGVFTNKAFVGPGLHHEDLKLFRSILGIKFDESHNLSLSVQSRQRLLAIIVNYYELHLTGFYEPKSIAVLKNLF
ncbi:DNA repair protein RecO [Flavicella marina]|uniref:DNA repair protein RecO n=1 Tax=Flavicella marina TaxID=1475951 RepID=UPI001264AC9C|nr:DNA repair protein RecO [Flavicella marina]